MLTGNFLEALCCNVGAAMAPRGHSVKNKALSFHEINPANWEKRVIKRNNYTKKVLVGAGGDEVQSTSGGLAKPQHSHPPLSQEKGARGRTAKRCGFGGRKMGIPRPTKPLFSLMWSQVMSREWRDLGVGDPRRAWVLKQRAAYFPRLRPTILWRL